MPWNAPNILTLLRLALIPALIGVYYLPFSWAPAVAVTVFVVAAITDLLDGYLARRLNQISPLGRFLDPVADKLIVAAALVLLAADPEVHRHAWDRGVFTITVLIIVGREIAVSALREWMAELGKRARVAVSHLGKVKTVMQMVAISFLLYRGSLWGIPIMRIGEVLLYVAGVLTLWSMLSYLKAAWPALMAEK